ncbi:hypothetical protein MKZ38_002871 [Zalerion maritima]|uniref:UDP-glucose:glycoprotein glucosyltransferase n=1 Tax=Zalerion maritima TaxID=339359 RepID=A0AAD5RX22_9PEZI|nr:hypothetical protein MKZ38_002871 [Zalerion maritima]
MFGGLRLPSSLTALALGAGLLNYAPASAAPSVDISMNAAFPAPPYIVELLETTASENETAYFPLLDRIARGDFAKATTDKELYDAFLEVIEKDGIISNAETLSTFKLALSMRSAAPRIEAHYQYYDTAVAPSLVGSQDSCKQWIWMDGKQYCDPLLETVHGAVRSAPAPETLPFDRSMGSGPDAILYADITCACWGNYHEILYQKAQKGEVSYRLRYRRSKSVDGSPLPVSGYGVELALKRTDYIVIDDRESDSEPIKPATDSSQVVLDGVEEVADLKPLSSSELSHLGLSAASFIATSKNPMDTLLKVTQDFPKYSTLIASHNASEQFIEEYKENQANMVPGGYSVLWMNGIQLIERQIETYTLIDMLRKERNLIDAVRALGLTGSEAISLLSHEEVTKQGSRDEDGPRFDWRDDIEGGNVIMWLNDIVKDDRYEKWPSSMYTLMQRMMPGQLPAVRREMFTLVVPVDFADPEDVALVTGQLWGFVERMLPIRFGLVPMEKSDVSKQQAKVLYHILQAYGPEAMIAYLKALDANAEVVGPDSAAYEEALKEREPLPETDPLPFTGIADNESLGINVGHAKAWILRLYANSEVPPLFVNGVAFPRSGRWMSLISQRLGWDLQTIQQGLFMGNIDDTVWIPGMFLEDALARRNVHIVPNDDNPIRIADIHKIYSDHDAMFSKLPVIEPDTETTKEHWAALTVVADLSTDAGLELLFNAIQFRENNPGIRVDIAHNPRTASGASKLISSLVGKEAELLEVVKLEEMQAIVKENEVDEALDLALANFLDDLSLAPGSQNLILNGRIVGPIGANPPFLADDFQQLLEFEQTKRIIPVYKAIDALGIGEKVPGPIGAAKLTSVTSISGISDLPEGIFEQTPPTRTDVFKNWGTQHVFFDVGNAESASIHFTALLNPASEQAQRWIPILKTLSEMEGVYLKIYMNPKQKLEELPVKRFFRYVLESSPSFDESGKVKPIGAVFKGVPSEALLTAGMNIPPAWLVAPKFSVHDLDNIKLGSVKADVTAVYELEHILIEGHSRETAGPAPRGAQLVLATETDPHFADTIVMANLGYFQFKANPGFYHIDLKAGRSSEIYEIESLGTRGYSAASGDEGNAVALMDFQGTTLYPRLKRKPGMEEEDVLEVSVEEEEPEDIVGKGLRFAESLFGGGSTGTKSVSDTEHAEINIFSVASGHLYERMLNIMMKSVMAHTNHTVKFWFIEQFLSPSFKDFIPHLAREYGFKYEMVTYKWPHWLRAQKEKQREIWGYKILFLDVLFPLSLDKVIFVDADQIVRTDMIELVNHDLEGAPYGFTPMCDSRTEMEGFRFWKQGYWANFLRGKPYHISALYVVDLKKFRQIAAGDRLRQQYHSLSADPGSLSNLDQDLPNHMQHQLRIHSLPQEWLWCETWCSDESLAEARTIDLCNNPMTKEPKLDRARRQVPEWTVYDEEIAAMDRKRKGLPPKEAEIEKGEEEEVEKNPKSRRFEDESFDRAREEEAKEGSHIKDEL